MKLEIKKKGFLLFSDKGNVSHKKEVASSAETYHEKMLHHSDYTNKEKKKKAIPRFFLSEIAT